MQTSMGSSYQSSHRHNVVYWIEIPNGNHGNCTGHNYICSNCGYEFTCFDGTPFEYAIFQCRRCKAKMIDIKRGDLK